MGLSQMNFSKLKCAESRPLKKPLSFTLRDVGKTELKLVRLEKISQGTSLCLIGNNTECFLYPAKVMMKNVP